MTDEKQETTEKPFFLIEPKISGYGLVFKKDGSISVPQPKEKEDGCNSDDSGT
jgi:hypothetical protein